MLRTSASNCSRKRSTLVLWDALSCRPASCSCSSRACRIHCVTSVNALHYAYQQSGSTKRGNSAPQAAAFLAMFRARMGSNLKDRQLDTMEKVAVAAGPQGIEEILPT